MVSLFHREICPCIRESRGGWGMVCTDYGRIYRAKTVVLSVKDLRSLCTRSRGTFEGRNLADRDINPVSEHRERERETRAAIMRDTYFLPLV